MNRYRFKHALVTVHLCKPCAIKYKCDCKKVTEKETENDEEKKICKKCKNKHVWCKSKECSKSCMRYRCNSLICKNCKEERIECERTMIRKEEEFKKIPELIFFSGQFEKGVETGKFHEQFYCQFKKYYNLKKIKEIFGNDTINIKKKDYGVNESMSAINMKNYSIKKYVRCKIHINCRCKYDNIEEFCKVCNEECLMKRDRLIIEDDEGNELSTDVIGPFIHGNFNMMIEKMSEYKDVEENGGHKNNFDNNERNEYFENDHEENNDERFEIEEYDSDGLKSKNKKNHKKNNEKTNQNIITNQSIFNNIKAGKDPYEIVEENVSLLSKITHIKILYNEKNERNRRNIEKTSLEYRSKYSIDDFYIPKIMDEWVEKNIFGEVERAKSLIVRGCTRSGKTEWARMYGKHLYYCGNMDKSIWNNDARYIIFDDFRFLKRYAKDISSNFSEYKEFLFCQKEFNIIVPYSKNTIKNRGTKPLIVLCNDDELDPIRYEMEQNPDFFKNLLKNSLIINLGNFDMRKTESNRIRYGSETMITYMTEYGNEETISLSSSDFDYGYTKYKEYDDEIVEINEFLNEENVIEIESEDEIKTKEKKGKNKHVIESDESELSDYERNNRKKKRIE
jgi:hypothetical protein